MNSKLRSFNRQRGMSVVPVMIFALGFGAVGVSIMSMSNTQANEVKGAGDKWQTDGLASSGANILYEQIRQQMIQDQSYPFVLAETPQKVKRPDNTEDTIGTCSARIVADRLVEKDEGGYRIQTYYFTIEGRGVSSLGKESITRVEFKGVMWRHLVPRDTYGNNGAPDSIWFPTGAIVANGAVNMTTNQGIRTLSSNGDAHVVGNKGITWNPFSGSKNSFANPNIIDIQGYYLVPDGGPYTSTLSNSGLANPSGVKNYRSPAAPAQGDFPGAAANSVIKLNGEASFPDAGTVDGWAADYLNSASVSTAAKFPTGLNSSAITPRVSDGQIGVQSPALITGDLNVANGATVHLWPASTNPKKNIIYVKGNVKNLGNIINHGCTLIFEQTYEDASSATYRIEQDALTFKTKEEAVMKSALLSLKSSKDAFKFHTNGSATTGLIYAMKGGIQIDGSNADFTGMLLAGGSGTNGNIDVKPGGGNSFTVHYEAYAATGGNVVTDAESVINTEYVAGNVAQPFTPTKMYNWNWIK
ncbi:MAG: hypothetical protein WCK51_07005 [Armatimonadota bacterium]